MLGKVRKYIDSYSLLNREALHLVALSGGADSVCLLLVMRKLGYRVSAVHCNFHLRGSESDRDEEFCRDLCADNDIDFHVVHFDTRVYADCHKVSIEMAARELRYSYFEKLRHDIGASDICVAHHRDDSVETLIMNLIRGTGIHGLQGIKPRNGNVVRPLLCVSRDDIESWLCSEKQYYVTDSTNLEADVVRNKIRLKVIPLLKSINPSVNENVAKTALRMVEAGKIFDNAISKSIECISEQVDGVSCLDIDRLFKCPSPEYVLFSVFSKLGFTSSQIEDMARVKNGKTGKRWESKDYVAVVDRKRIIYRCKPKERNLIVCKIPEEGNYILSEGIDHTEKITVKAVVVSQGFTVIKERYTACLDYAKIQYPLLLRYLKNGDEFVPFGMKGRKLVSDYLTDRKRTLFQKEDQMVLEDASGRIVWLVGERVDDRFCVDDDTNKSLVVRYYN